MNHYTFDIFSCEQMDELGKKLSRLLPNGTVVALVGDLGAGKTTLVRSVAKGLGVDEVVQSPTFNIMKLYLKGNRPLIHIDAYRLADLNTDIGLDEYIGYETGLTMIEWPMYIESLLPEDALWIDIKSTGETSRKIDIYSSNNSLVEVIKNG